MEAEPSMSTRNVCEESEEGTSDVPDSNEESKGELTNALRYAESLLFDLHLVTSTPPSTISERAKVIGEAICNAILDLLAEKRIVCEDELITVDEKDDLQEYTACDTVSFTFVWFCHVLVEFEIHKPN